MSILGIDIGGSGIKGALVDVKEGKFVSERYRIATPEGGKPEDIADVVKKLVNYFDYSGIVGCTFPSVIKNGIALTAANVDQSWIGMNIPKLFKKKAECDFIVMNDADAAGFAEFEFGHIKGNNKDVVIFLTIGTGIGSAIFLNGELLPNTEFGHMEIRGKDAEHRASDAVRKKNNMGWKDWAKNLEEYLQRLEALFYPDLFILGGGVSKQSEKYLPYIELNTRIIPAKLKNKAGIIGAAVYVSKFKKQ
ncbi:MAG: ROK family protein [Anaerolineaceae bacterium]|nr:ROK family protein [Anaerolineaceae bacterium]